MFFHQVASFQAVGGLKQMKVTLRSQDLFEPATNYWMVVYDQYFSHYYNPGPGPIPVEASVRTLITVPFRGVPSIEKLPPIDSARSRIPSSPNDCGAFISSRVMP